jgi:hypothetical protein
VRAAGWLGYAAVAFIALAWYWGVRFGHDSRDGRDWESSAGPTRTFASIDP